MKDIRLSIDFFDHPKTVKLRRRLGYEGVEGLVRLWFFAAQNRSSGVLDNMDSEDIEIAAKWEGEQGLFVETLHSLRWLELDDDGILCLKNWERRNGFVANSENRSRKARIAAAAKWGSTVEDDRKTRSQRLSEARKLGRHTSAEWDEMKAFFGNACLKCLRSGPDVALVKDHIVPIYQGGSDGLDNIQPLCRKCNASKGPEKHDYRPSYCEDNDLVLPEKYELSENDACSNACEGGQMSAETPAPSPNPIPSPEPFPIPFPKNTLAHSGNARAGMETETDVDSDEKEPRAPGGKPGRAMTGKDAAMLERFEQFWKIYPRKKSKGDAKKAWMKLKPDESLLAIITAKIEQARTQDSWQRDGGKYIPYPATWLNAEGWEDEIEIAKTENVKRLGGVRYDFTNKVYTGTPPEQIPWLHD